MRRNIFICLLLAGVTLAIYWPVRHYGIVNFDDPLFVTKSAEIQSGLNWHSFWWALSSVVGANWHPVTSLSFVLDHQVFGTNPGAEHLVNVLFHAANAVLLFLVLSRMTGAVWRSAVVAAIFAWHPLRVESVVWISERKDVLSGFFFLLTLWAWVRYVEGVTGDAGQVTGPGKAIRPPFMSRITGHGSRCYWLALVFFALGLMSKPMLVTLPFLLGLLDIWPLQRISNFKLQISNSKSVPQLAGAAKQSEGGSTLNHLLFEKWPFFALAAFFSWLTYHTQKNCGAMLSWENLGGTERISNAVSSCLQYLAKLFWPAKLAVIYPYPKSHDALEVCLTGLLLAAVSALCVRQIKRRPYLAVGWFWYLVAMLPVIGLVQVGEQAMADRYTYLPLIGPVVSLVWLVGEWSRSNFLRTIPLRTAAILLLAACAISTRRQMQFWKSGVGLFEHAIAVTAANSAAQSGLGIALDEAGYTRQAMVHYRVAMKINPAESEVHHALGRLLMKQGKWQAAADIYSDVLNMDPDDLTSHLQLAAILRQQGRMNEAILHLEAALRTNPDSEEALNNLAWARATTPEADLRDGARAVELAEHACELSHYRKTLMVGTLAAAYAEAGRFDEAIATAEKACALAKKSGDQNLLKKNRELTALYQKHQSYHE